MSKRRTWHYRRYTTLLLAFSVLLAACGGGQPDAGDTSATTDATESPTTAGAEAEQPSGPVSFFAFEDAFLPAVLDPLRAAYPDLDIQTATFASEDESETKLRAGFQADVVNTCAGPIESMVEGDLLQPIDTSRITDWDQLFPVFEDAPGVVVDGEVYMVPQFGGSTGIIYDSEAWPEGTTSYADLFSSPDVPGTIAIGDGVIVTFAIAAMAAGIEDPYTTELTQEEIDMVKDFMIDRKDSRIRTTFSSDSDIVSLLQGGEVIAAAPGYPGVANILNEAAGEERFKWVGADEGSFVWVCGQSLSANAENVDGAYAIMDWYFRPETALEFAKTYQYFGGNGRILDVATPEEVERYALDGPEQVFGSSMIAIQPSNFDAWLDAWREFLAS